MQVQQQSPAMFLTNAYHSTKAGIVDKNKKCVSDLLKLCLDPTCQMPELYALGIARLPPVGVDHIDVGALLQEITGLRQEVRNIANVRTELDALNSSARSCNV